MFITKKVQDKNNRDLYLITDETSGAVKAVSHCEDCAQDIIMALNYVTLQRDEAISRGTPEHN